MKKKEIIKTLRKGRDRALEEIESLKQVREQLDSAVKEIVQLRQANARQEEAIKLYKADKISTDKELYNEAQGLQNQIENNRKTIDKLIINKAAFEKRINELEKQVKKLQFELTEETRRADNNLQELNDHLNYLKLANTTNNDLTIENTQLKSQVESLQRLHKIEREKLSAAHNMISENVLISQSQYQELMKMIPKHFSFEEVKKYEPRGRGDNSPCKNCGQMKWNHAVGWVCKKETALDKIKRQYEGGQAKPVEVVRIKVIEDGPFTWYKIGQEFDVVAGEKTEQTMRGPITTAIWVVVCDNAKAIPQRFCNVIDCGVRSVKMEDCKVEAKPGPEETVYTFYPKAGTDMICQNCGKPRDQHLHYRICV